MLQKSFFVIIGGMSHQSSVLSSELVYDLFREKTGGNSCPKMITYELDMCEVERLQKAGDKNGLFNLMKEADHSNGYLGSGAEFGILCSNTMHEFVDAFETLELLDIREIKAKAVLKKKITKVALLGTCFTMEQDFYRKKLEEYDLGVIIPNQDDRKMVSRIIYDELCKGTILSESEVLMKRVIDRLKDKGAEGVILGCTELPLLIKKASIPIFNTTALQAEAAVNRALGIE